MRRTLVVLTLVLLAGCCGDGEPSAPVAPPAASEDNPVVVTYVGGEIWRMYDSTTGVVCYGTDVATYTGRAISCVVLPEAEPVR